MRFLSHKARRELLYMTSKNLSRSTRITFAGVSTLSKDKAQGLCTSLQTIILQLVRVHNACEDPKLNVDDRYKQLGALSIITKDVETVNALVQEELSSCAPAMRVALSPRATIISNSAAILLKTFAEYSDTHPNRALLVQTIFENLLKIVQETINMLSEADKHMIEEYSQATNEGLLATKAVREASTVPEFNEAQKQFGAAAHRVVALLTPRCPVLPTDAKAKATKAIDVVRDSAPRLLAAKGELLTNPFTSPQPFEAATLACTRAFQDLHEASAIAPEFSVNFDVEYFGDPVSINIAGMRNASEIGDRDSLVEHAKRLVSDVQWLISQGRRVAEELQEAERGKILDACQEATGATVGLVRACEEAVGERVKFLSGLEGNSWLESEKRMVEAAKRLRELMELIPITRPAIKSTVTSSLLNAAKRLMGEFNTLLQPVI